jgi:hypothetical protein
MMNMRSNRNEIYRSLSIPRGDRERLLKSKLGVEEWRSGGVEEWRSGGVEEWRSGGVDGFYPSALCLFLHPSSFIL